MAYLYLSPKNNYPVTSHSYSGGALFDDCPAKYNYDRRQGYKDKDRRASTAFGNAVEAVIQYYHSTGQHIGDSVDEFKRLWLLEKNNPELAYSDKEDWDVMYQQGAEMIRLYDVMLPNLPISSPQFQLNYKKEFYPDSDYAGLNDTAYIDMLVDAPAEHPLLPPHANKQLIVDIKTSGVMYPSDPRLVALDGQLRRYAWTSGIGLVSFLVLVKRGIDFERGDPVTLIGWWNDTHALGSEMVVFDASKSTLTLLSPKIYDQYEKEAKGLKGNALKDKKAEFITVGWEVAREDVTKQRLQFLAAVITEENRYEAGELAGMQARNICDANLNDFFPKRPGIKFPNNHCLYCSHLGLCIGDQDMVKQKLVQISGPKQEDWLEDL